MPTMDLYLSKSELAILNVATLLWGCWQWYDLVDRFVFQRFTSDNTQHFRPGTDGRANAREGHGANAR